MFLILAAEKRQTRLMNVETVLRPKFGLKRFEVSGDPYERGHSYGETYRQNISRFLEEQYYDLYTLGKTREASKEDMLKFAKRYAPYIEGYSPEIFEEMRGLADGSGKAFEEIVLISMHEEKSIFGEKDLMKHCKVVAATGSATIDGETYIGQTWDAGYQDFWEGDQPLLLHERRSSGPDILAYNYPGLIAAAGINSEGISLTWTSTPRAPFVVGVPTYVIIGEVLRKKTIGEALQAIVNPKRAGSFKFTIADKNGEIYVIEATPSHHHLIYVDDFYGYSADFESEEIRREAKVYGSEWLPVAANRARKLLKTACGKLDINVLKSVLSDHPYICVHPVFKEGKWTGGISRASWIMVPPKREWWITHGPPCQNELIKYTV